MNNKTVIGSTLAAGLLGLGMLVGSAVGNGQAFAQTVAATPTPAAVQAAPTTPGSAAPAPAAPGASGSIQATITQAQAEAAALAAQAKVTQAQAEAAALAASPGNTVDHSRLGSENGTVFWDIDFTNGGGVTVNAVTGAVIATEAAGTDQGGHGRRPAPAAGSGGL